MDVKKFGEQLYNRFPFKYREDDVKVGFTLKRYIEALNDGGFSPAIVELEGLPKIVDPENTEKDVLPILFQHYGLDIFNGIPEAYLRYLLPKLGEAYERKGSLSVVEFITTAVAGVVTHTEVIPEDRGNKVIVRLEMDYNLGEYYPDTEQLIRLLNNFLPFYCTILLIYVYNFEEEIKVSLNDSIFEDYISEENKDLSTLGLECELQESLKTEVLEKTLLGVEESLFEKIPCSDSGYISIEESSIDRILTNEDASIEHFGNKEQSAILGYGVLGKFILGENQGDVDKCD